MSKGAWALAVALVLAVLVFFAWREFRDPGEEQAAATTAALRADDRPRAEEPPAPATEEHERADVANDADATDAAPSSDTPTADTPPPARGVTLYGFVRPPPGQRELGEEVDLGVVDRLGARDLAKADVDGAYSIPDLALGTYWVWASSRRSGSAHARVELDGREREVRLDLLLQRELAVLVKIVDRAGAALDAKEFPVIAVATREPPGAWLDEIRGSVNNTFGAGHFEHNEFGGARLEQGYIGKVVLDVPPPVFVSLVAYQRVVATRRIEPGQSEVVFSVDRDEPLVKPGGVSFRFVDAETRADVACSRVHLNGHFTTTLEPGDDGVFRFAKAPPGWYEIVAMEPGYERAHHRVLVEAGVQNDLGAIELARELTLDARVVDEQGNGVAASFLIERFDRVANRPLPAPVGFQFTSKADGSLHIGGLSHELYALRLFDSKDAWADVTKVVDLHRGSLSDLRIQLARGVPLVLQPSPGDWRRVQVTILDAGGLYVTSRTQSPFAPEAVKLAPGSYALDVVIDEAQAQRRAVALASEPVELAVP